MSTFVLPLADPGATLETVGGKGMSLAKMAQAGLPVPGGFHITTEAYRCFVAENGIQSQIMAVLDKVDQTDPVLLENISQQIESHFINGVLPAEIVQVVSAAYDRFPKETPVAVRSSATAEDLPEASFAGQQETYLNISGKEALLAAIKKCWASLWTARAIMYRARQGIAPDSVALAVVVQELVFADASGVLFTANPVSGKRNEMMMTATWGLGEALVGGMVTPDTIITAKPNGTVIQRTTSQKQVMTVRAKNGTQECPIPGDRQKLAVLNDRQAASLTALGRTIEQLYGAPMDIEWTLSGGKFAVVQARPITSLPEPPLEWVRANPKVMLARGSFAEFVPDAVSPLFATLGIPIAHAATQKMLKDFFGVGGVNSAGYVFEVVNGYAYIGVLINGEVLWKMTIIPLFQMKRVLETSRALWSKNRDKNRALAAHWQLRLSHSGDLAALSASELLHSARELFTGTAEYYTGAQTGPIPTALMSEAVFTAFYNMLIKRKTDPEAATFLVGMDTIALRAEKSLYDLSQWVKNQADLADYIQQTATNQICAALKTEPQPAPLSGEFTQRLAGHLSQFGHTIYDLDFAKPVPADDPTPIIEGLKAYLNGTAASPYERQKAQITRREQAAQTVLSHLDPIRRNWFTRLLKGAQESGPGREDCIADLGLGYPELRMLLAEFGRRLVGAGMIAQPEDVYWLEAQEVAAAAESLDAGKALAPHHDKVENRKAFWRRARELTPPAAIPEKSIMARFLVHDNPDGSLLKGTATSGGKVTARACVLHGPDEFGSMQPGDVIVAVTTTPAWTPLFAIASAVVTDIGGPLSHSSIVAREYGIPAVMATGVATKRIHTGQIITVDGNTGKIIVQE